MNIVILGPQGSGKTTQAKLISDYLELPHISIGRTLRSIVLNPNHALNSLISNSYIAGDLVDDTIVNSLLNESVSKAVDSGGMILDGVPRRMSQYSLLDEILAIYNQKIDFVIYINTSIMESRARIIKRALIENRPDDTVKAVNTRLSIYNKQTIPILKKYKDRGVLKTVDGNKSIESIFDNIKKIVDTHTKS